MNGDAETQIIERCRRIAYDTGTKASNEDAFVGVQASTVAMFSNAIQGTVGGLQKHVASYNSKISAVKTASFGGFLTGATAAFSGLLTQALGYPALQEKHNQRIAEMKRKYPAFNVNKIKERPRSTEDDTLWLIAIILMGLSIESFFGAFLLGEALAGGLIAALAFAFTISLVNVGGLGLGLGKLFVHFHKKHAIKFVWFGLWIVIVGAVNIGIAYSRYDGVSGLQDGIGENIDPVLALVLFAMLGMIFAGFAFWQEYKKWEPEALLHADYVSLMKKKDDIFGQIVREAERAQNSADDAQKQVLQFYEHLNLTILEAKNNLSGLRMFYGSAQDIIEHSFVEGWNVANVRKISRTDIKLAQKFPSWDELRDGFPSIAAADEIMRTWNEGGRDAFVNSHSQFAEQITKHKVNTSRGAAQGMGLQQAVTAELNFEAE